MAAPCLVPEPLTTIWTTPKPQKDGHSGHLNRDKRIGKSGPAATPSVEPLSHLGRDRLVSHCATGNRLEIGGGSAQFQIHTVGTKPPSAPDGGEQPADPLEPAMFHSDVSVDFCLNSKLGRSKSKFGPPPPCYLRLMLILKQPN